MWSAPPKHLPFEADGDFDRGGHQLPPRAAGAAACGRFLQLPRCGPIYLVGPRGCRSGRPYQLVGRCGETCLGRKGCCHCDGTCPWKRCKAAASGPLPPTLYAAIAPRQVVAARRSEGAPDLPQVEGGRFASPAAARPRTTLASKHRSGLILKSLIQTLLGFARSALKIIRRMESG